MPSEYIGKDIRYFKFVAEGDGDIYSLRPGEFFVEDGYPEVHQVVEVRSVDNIPTIFAHNLTRNIQSAWSYTEAAYAPVVFKVKPK